MVMVAVNVFNLLIDPYRVFLLVDTGLTQYRNKTRITSSVMLRKQQFDTVIIGSSRTMLSIDVDSRHLAGNRVYNASMIGTDFSEIALIVDYTLEHQRELKNIILGLDFLLFTARTELHDEFHLSLFDESTNSALMKLKLAGSASTLEDSWETLTQNISPSDDISYIKLGYVNKEVTPINHMEAFKRINREFMVSTGVYGGFEYGSEKVRMFERSLERIAEDKVKLYLFIAPMHARQYEMLYRLGLLEQYFRWMRDMTAAVERVRRAYPSGTVFWNFSGYNGITTESVPVDPAMQMKYHWESSHYKARVGDIMMESMLIGKSVVHGFGQALSAETIEGVISSFGPGRTEYIHTHPEDVSYIKELFDEIYGQEK